MITLVSGGAASGKSEYAENISMSRKNGTLIYIATMMPYDSECYKKIERHREMRKEKGFLTLECPYDLKSIKCKDISKDSTILLECISNLLANEMYDQNRCRENAVLEIVDGIRSLKGKCENLVIVTNEIFSDGNKYDKDTEEYIKNLGIINKELLHIADEVIEIVYGIEVRIK